MFAIARIGLVELASLVASIEHTRIDVRRTQFHAKFNEMIVIKK